MSVPITAINHIIDLRTKRGVLRSKSTSVMTCKHSVLTSTSVTGGTVSKRYVERYLGYGGKYMSTVRKHGCVSYMLGTRGKGRKAVFVGPTSRGGGITIMNTKVTKLRTTEITTGHKRRMAMFRGSSGVNKRVRLTTIPPEGDRVLESVRCCRGVLPRLSMSIGLGARTSDRRLGGFSRMVLTVNTRGVSLPVSIASDGIIST